MENQKKENGHAEIIETNPATLVQLAIQQNIDIDKLEKLLALQERWEANQARKAFFKALANFQSSVPVITKNKTADYGQGKTKYNYATLDQIISQIQEPLKNHGLSYRWEFAEKEKQISVTCIITHEGGHKETTVMSGSADNSGSKNDIQARGSTLTYLQRYTLIGALGIGTAQEDVDGHKKTEGKVDVDPEIMKSIELFTEENKLIEWAKGLDNATQQKVPFRTAVKKHIDKLRKDKVTA